MSDGQRAASIKRPSCRRDCRKTWRYEHGQAVPDGPFPGTYAQCDDVRRCEHGHIWWCPGEPHISSNFDTWERLSWWATPVRFLRAVTALRGEDE